MDLSKMNNADIVRLYSDAIKELKQRGILRTNNVIGDLGEYLAIETFSRIPGLPKLQAAPVGTQNIDAISRMGDRYSIKSTSGTTTGVFYGLEPKGSQIPDTQKFEYVLICKFDENCALEAIYQITWTQFLQHKHWHSRMQAWNLTLSKALIADATVIYRKADSAQEQLGMF